MSTDTRIPETTEQDLIDFWFDIIKDVPLRTMKQIREDRGPVTAKQADTVEIPVSRPGPRHLAPYRGPRLWRHPVQWVNWNFGYWIYWGLNEQNRHRSHRMV